MWNNWLEIQEFGNRIMGSMMGTCSILPQGNVKGTIVPLY